MIQYRNAIDNPSGVNIECATLFTITGNVSLLRDTDIAFNGGNRYGLVGRNGSGKTTLLSAIANRIVPVPNVPIYMVGQEQETAQLDVPIIDVIFTNSQILNQHLEAEQAGEPYDTQFVATAEARAHKILAGLGFCDHTRPLGDFSGGWRKRVVLACALFNEPEILLLDEPTNHLDLHAVLWLQNYLLSVYGRPKSSKILITTSHDINFLDAVSTHIVHIAMQKLTYYTGNYAAFVQNRALRNQQYDNLYEKQQKLFLNLKKKGVKSADAIAEVETKTRSKMLEQRRDGIICFPFAEPSGLRENYIMKLTDVCAGYEGNILFSCLNLAIWHDSKITICGKNGAGKSTFMKLLTGELVPFSGVVERNYLMRIGVYSQHFVDQLPLDQTAVDYLVACGAENEFVARKNLGSFGLPGNCHKSNISQLSGGQKARVAFAGIAIKRPHVLLLDEPTNHLDIESIEILTSSLRKFHGCVVVITHDAYLVKNVANRIWIVEDHDIVPYEGSFDEYRESLFEQ